jgi:hypothetical protein
MDITVLVSQLTVSLADEPLHPETDVLHCVCMNKLQVTSPKEDDVRLQPSELRERPREVPAPAGETQSSSIEAAIEKEEDSLPPVERVFGDVPKTANIVFVLGGPGSGKRKIMASIQSHCAALGYVQQQQGLV